MKRIITCSDGTWEKPGQKDNGVVLPSNLLKLKTLIAPKDHNGTEQVSLYDEGAGTEWKDKIGGGLFGMGINRNIIQAYQFIANHYDPGDEIWLFGFSRGAFTARSVAGFIRNSGLLRKEYLDTKSEDAFLFYKRRDDKSKPNSFEAIEFKRKYCYEHVRIKFVGVWDTVGESGIPLELFDEINRNVLDCRFHDLELSSYVDFAYHALAIDEHRKPFIPALWMQQQKAKDEGQIMEQMWFAGVHGDIGGGYKEHELSDCALLWMIEKAKSVGCEFKEYSSIISNPLGEMHNSMNLLYEISGSKNRTIGSGFEYNETIAPSALVRLKQNTDNYSIQVNPNLVKFMLKNKFRQQEVM
jgi:uncharacterized protein (DUF2235 family)